MSKVKIATIRFDESIHHIHIAYETIVAYSVVCVVNDNNESKVYTNQNVPFADGNPWVFGIAQNDAEPGQIVEVQYSGMSKVRFFSRNIPVNTIIFLQKNTNGVCCLANENGIEPFKKQTGDSENGYSIMCGFVPPRTQPIMGSTQEPREMLVDAWIHITTLKTEDNLTLRTGIWNYKTTYYYYETDGTRVGPLEFVARVLVEPMKSDFYVATVVGTQYTIILNLLSIGDHYLLEGFSDMDNRIWNLEPKKIEEDQIIAVDGSYKAENGILLGQGGKRARCYAKVSAFWIGEGPNN